MTKSQKKEFREGAIGPSEIQDFRCLPTALLVCFYSIPSGGSVLGLSVGLVLEVPTRGKCAPWYVPLLSLIPVSSNSPQTRHSPPRVQVGNVVHPPACPSPILGWSINLHASFRDLNLDLGLWPPNDLDLDLGGSDRGGSKECEELARSPNTCSGMIFIGCLYMIAIFHVRPSGQ